MSKSKKGCCLWLTKCFTRQKQTEETKESSNQNDNEIINGRHSSNNNENNNIIEQQEIENNRMLLNKEDDYILIKIQHISKKFQINTKFERHNIEMCEIKDENIKENALVRYNCPICFKFYFHILKSSCCSNFICLICAQDYITTQIKYDLNPKCPFCGYDESTIILSDITPNEKPKKYTDSPDQRTPRNNFDDNIINLKNITNNGDATKEINEESSINNKIDYLETKG